MIQFFSHESALKILFVSPEAQPFVKAGGLGEVVFALSNSLKKQRHDVRLMLPRYAEVDSEKYKLEMECAGLKVPTDTEDKNQPEFLICNVKKFSPNAADVESRVITYFLENQEYYEKRSNIYGYADDAVRWALLSRGVLEFLDKASDWVPDVIICSDWQTGFLPNYLRTSYKTSRKLKATACVFVIHNLYYQGMFDHRFVPEMERDDGHSPVPSLFNERLLKINSMRRGIIYSDVINTVSPTYSQEIMNPEHGELLDDLLRERRSRVYGTLNGLDYQNFNPDSDAYLAEKFSVRALDKRSKNRAELQSRFGLPKNKDGFIIGIVSRLTEQKGFDLLLSVIDKLLSELNMQLVVVGAGEGKYMTFFKDLATKFPDKVGVHLIFDPDLPRLIYAGSDSVLIPSKFEPSGLTQMEAMRYGSVPIVRKTGGLADTVEDYDPGNGAGTGFVFTEFDSLAMSLAISRAYEMHKHKTLWEAIQKRAMRKDFSWEKSAKEYQRLCELAISLKRKAKIS